MLLCGSILLLAVTSCLAAKSGYLMTVPKILHPGVEEKVCFQFFHVKGDIEVDLILNTTDTTSEAQSFSFTQGEGGCVDYLVPSLTHTQADLYLTGRSTRGKYNFNGSTTVSLQTPAPITFIQTDKPQYKPGQTVKCRVLSLDANLRPITDAIHAIWIEDPSGVRMAQWLDMVTVKGLVSIEFQTSTEPVQGVWFIKVQLRKEDKPHSRGFKIEEYVLPKYEVTIKPPSWLPITAQRVTGEVCARYTYGKVVRGRVDIKLCIANTYRMKERPCMEIAEQRLVDGCHKIDVNISALELQSSKWPIWGATLQIDAKVTEDGTGVELTKSDDSAKVERYLVKMDFKPHTPEYFKPSLPFHGKLIVKDGDGSPKANEKVYITGTQFNLEATSNSNGIVDFEIDTSNLPLDNSFTLSASTDDPKAASPADDSKSRFYSQQNVYTTYSPRGYHSIKPWFSPSGSYIQMTQSAGAVQCGADAEIPVKYTTEHGSNFTFHYQVMSRGNIVLEGKKTHLFLSSGSLDSQGSVAADEPLLPPPTGTPLPARANFVLRVPISRQMSPLARVLLYYIREDREVVADSITIPVQRCLENEVSLTFIPSEVYPGAQTSMELKADPESLCSVGVVDKSVHVLGGNNQLNKAKVFDILSGYDIDENAGPYMRDQYCDNYVNNHGPRPGRGPKGPRGRAPRRERRSSMPWWPGSGYSEQFDAIKAFKTTGVHVLSDNTIETRTCKEQRMLRGRVEYSPAVAVPQARGMPGPQAGGLGVVRKKTEDEDEMDFLDSEEKQKTVDIRTYFPETWLWNLYDMEAATSHTIDLEVPHTITDWIGSAFCTNDVSGLGVTDSTVTLRAFQPFFLSMTLPYSAVRGETLRTPVSVFNYLKECIVVELTMVSTTEVSVAEPSRKVCVCGGETGTEYFMVTASQVGHVNITASAVSVQNEDWRCENHIVKSLEDVRDAATRPLLIEPEGKAEEYTISQFICPAEGEVVEEEVDLDLPEVGLVEDSASATVSVIGDVMGPTLSNLDSLIRLPMGCGEQNMLLFAPNIYVVQYLEATNQMSGDLRTQAINHMKTGYQRELTYRHDDGSYSAFGMSDESGSTWLTAFVVRCFAQAQRYIFIDDTDLKASIEWFRTIQKENGCFKQVGKVLHKDMKGGLGDGGSDAGLTAYVLMALIDAGVPATDSMMTEGLSCLTSFSQNQDTYTTALITYVASRLGDSMESMKDEMKEKMEEMATNDGTSKHWSKHASTTDDIPATTATPSWSHGYAQSADVEMTAYALMAYLHMAERSDKVGEGMPMVRWLSSQRNANGGFSSTQDTVVALQSLAEYAALVYSDDVDVRVTAQDSHGTPALREPLRVTAENSLLLHQYDVPVPNTLSYSVSGTGCVLVQANVRYHRDPEATEPNIPSFTAKVNVKNHREVKDHCRYRKLNICARYNSDEPSNMAVVEIKMQTGWIPDKMSLKQMVKDGVKNLMRQEIDHNKVHLYFDELVREYTCVEFLVEEDMRVSDPKMPFVHVYDYYDTKLAHVANYAIKTTCGTKEELPELTPEEYEDLADAGFEGQIRQPNTNPFEEQDHDCPICYNSSPANLNELLCSATHVYKSVVKKGKIRLLSDQRKKTRLTFGKTIYVKEDNLGFPLEHCDCDIIEEPMSASTNMNTRVLLLTENELSEATEGRNTIYSLDLASNDVVVPLDDDRALRRALRSCGD